MRYSAATSSSTTYSAPYLLVNGRLSSHRYRRRSIVTRFLMLDAAHRARLNAAARRCDAATFYALSDARMKPWHKSPLCEARCGSTFVAGSAAPLLPLMRACQFIEIIITPSAARHDINAAPKQRVARASRSQLMLDHLGGADTPRRRR